MKVVSFFSGCGGLDLGFEQAGFEVVWANDNDPAVSETYQLNHPNTYLCKRICVNLLWKKFLNVTALLADLLASLGVRVESSWAWMMNEARCS